MKTCALPVACVVAALLSGCNSYDDDAYDFRFEVGPTIDPNPPVANEAFEISFRARNSGDWDAEDVLWTVYRDDTAVENGYIDLDENESRDVNVLMDADTPGVHTYRVELDSDDHFDEDDESNNEASITVTVALIVDPG